MKKIIRHINRTLLRCLEIAGVLALVLVLAWLGLLWRLSQGPLDVNPWLTEKMEQAFARDVDGFSFKLGSAQLTWGGRFEPFEFEMRDVKIARSDSTPVLDVRKLRVQLSKRNLVFGRIVPRIIRLYGPALRVIRQEDGQFSLNVGTTAPDDAEPLAPPDTPAEQSRHELVKGVLKLLQEKKGLGLLDGLNEVTISDAALLYEDRVLGVRWLTRNADIGVTRGENGIRATSLVTVDMDASQKATVRADVNYDWDTQRTEATVAFTGFVPAKIAQSSSSLKPLADIDMTFSGSLSFGLDADFRASTGRFALGADAGTFNILGLYTAPVPIKGLFASGKLDVGAGRAEITELKADLGGPQLVATAQIVTEQGLRVATLKGTLVNMPLDGLNVYWPETIAPSARDWIVKHITAGISQKATIEMVAAYDAMAEKKIAVRSLGGKIEFTGTKVNYFPPLPPVLDVGGTAVYDQTSFHMDLTGGKLEDMKAGRSKVDITDLDKIADGGRSKIDIAATVSGPLKTALKVLDSKPLGYPAMLGIKSDSVEGKAEIEIGLKFPIHKALQLRDIVIGTKAKLKEVLLKDVVAGMDLTGGPMGLAVTNEQLNVTGKARLAGMSVDFDWVKYFHQDSPIASKLKASLDLDAPALGKFGIPENFAISGTLPATVEYSLKQDKSATLSLAGDMRPLGFSVPLLNFSKGTGVEGKIALTAVLQDNKLQRITGLNLSGGGIGVKGDIDFVSDGMGALDIRKAAIRQFVLGATDVAVNVEARGKDGYTLNVTGRQIDASPLFKDNIKPNNDADMAKPVPPVRLNLSVNRVIAGPERFFESVKVLMERNGWKRMDRLEVDAKAGGKPLTLRYLPVAKGHSLKFEAQDAGAALATFGFAKSIRGGILRVDGRPKAQSGARDMVGTATLNNFRINNAPVIAKILNALSLVGLFQMMSDNGLAFKKASVDFAWFDKGQPAQSENVRLLKLTDGKTFGSSLGLTFEGNIDNWKNVYDLNGTIVPVSDLSKIISIIPIIGTVLTAGGEGIFAATYSVTGPKEDPKVSVNPLAVLAPGILRKMFFR